MPQIGNWNGHVFEVSDRLIRGFTELSIQGGCETTEKNTNEQKYVERKYGNAQSISLVVGLNALLGVTDVQGEAMQFVAEAEAGATAYFYLGSRKLVSCQMMLTRADVVEIVTAPGRGDRWISCNVRITLQQASDNDGGIQAEFNRMINQRLVNPDWKKFFNLIQIVSHKTHNYIHNKLGYTKRELYLVYGPPLAGKSTYVSSVMDPGDLIIEIDRIWTCISGLAPEQKPKRLNAVVFKLRDTLLEAAKYRIGYWNNCYIVGGYPLISERERLCKELGAREIYIDTDRDTCLARLSTASNLDQEAYKKYIDDWFRKYSAGLPPSGS